MKVSSTLRFRAPARQVSDMMVSPSFQEMIGQGLKASECSTVAEPDAITSTYLIPTSDTLRLVAAGQSKLIGHLRWTTPLVDGRRQGDILLEVEHFPSRFSGTVYLAQQGEYTTVTYDADVTVDVPLVGGKLERKIGELTVQILNAGQAMGEQWLAARAAA
ncbi:MAG: DUF2505 domain-containing protein [Propionibacteriaceae bacterium]|nr:DUF2505 domain-containing protein [Propionibacteriaceae bacterium]